MHFYLNRIKIGRYRIGNTVASLLTIFTILALLLGIIAAFVPTLVHQANNFATLDYQALGEKLQGPFSWLDLQAHRFGVIKPGTSLATEIQTALLQWFQPSMVSDIVGGVFATAGGIVVTISAVSFILFFFLQEQGLFSEIIHAIVPTEYEPKVLTAIDDSSEALTGYFRGLITQLASFSMMASVFLWILGVPYALLIGVAGGLLNIVPYVGPIIGLVFGCFIVLSSHLDLELVVIGTLMLKVCAAFLVTQAIDNLFLSTLIFSKSVFCLPEPFE